MYIHMISMTDAISNNRHIPKLSTVFRRECWSFQTASLFTGTVTSFSNCAHVRVNLHHKRYRNSNLSIQCISSYVEIYYIWGELSPPSAPRHERWLIRFASYHSTTASNESVGTFRQGAERYQQLRPPELYSTTSMSLCLSWCPL